MCSHFDQFVVSNQQSLYSIFSKARTKDKMITKKSESFIKFEIDIQVGGVLSKGWVQKARESGQSFTKNDMKMLKLGHSQGQLADKARAAAALQACAMQISSPIKMIKLANNCLALNQAGTRTYVLTSMIQHSFESSPIGISAFIDEPKTSFTKLERSPAAKTTQSHKSLNILARMGKIFLFDSTVSVLTT